MSRLDDIRARLDAATPGPWFNDDGDVHAWEDEDGRRRRVELHDDFFHRSEDAELAAHAPEDLRILLAVAEAARHLLQLDAIDQVSFEDWSEHCARYNEAHERLTSAVAALGADA